MGKSIRDGARAQEHQLGSLSELIHQHVHVAIELAVHEELRAALGATPYERSDVRRGYGNGTKARTLTGPTGAVQLSLPRATLFAGPKEWTSRIRVADTIPCRSRCDLLLPRWVCTARTQWRKGRERAGAGRCRCSHRWPQVPARVGAVRRRIVSHGKAVSMTSSRAGCGRRYWRSSTAILACAALSVRCGHARQSSSVASTSSVPRAEETEACARGDPRRLPPHRLRGQRRRGPGCLRELRAHAGQALPGRGGEPARRGQELLTFFTFPTAQWKTLGITNTIERLHEEFRRRVKTQGSLPSQDAAVVLLFSLLAKRADQSCARSTAGRRSRPCSASTQSQHDDLSRRPRRCPKPGGRDVPDLSRLRKIALHRPGTQRSPCDVVEEN